jgi:hypothetical protein
MFVFRLTDENVRRAEGKRKTPLVPTSLQVMDGDRVNRNSIEWIARYETFARMCAREDSRVIVSEDESAFKAEIDRVIMEATAVTDASLV